MRCPQVLLKIYAITGNYFQYKFPCITFCSLIKNKECSIPGPRKTWDRTESLAKGASRPGVPGPCREEGEGNEKILRAVMRERGG